MRLRTLFAVAAAISVAVTGLVTAGTIPSQAAAAPQPVTAWYMFGTTASALNAAAHNDGCTFATNAPDNYDILMLDFGAARDVNGGWGTLDFSGTLISNGTILGALESASDAVHDCYTQGNVIITYGNSNYDLLKAGMSDSDAFNAGFYQEQRASELVSYEDSLGRTDQTAAAASDMEPSWNGPGNTKQLAIGATAQGSLRYFDFGSADGCPTSGSGGSCNNGWGVSDVAYVSQAGNASSLPEIYPPLTTLASQWTVIRKNWDNSHSSSYHFSGVDGAPGNAQAGWTDLNSLNPGLVENKLICFGC
jgi:hypothetical protein